MPRRMLALLAVLLLMVAACGNSDDDDDDDTAGGDDDASTETTGGTRPPGQLPPGVTEDTIRVGGIASATNGLNTPHGDAFKGTRAYFDKVNAEGGVFGKKIEIVAEIDDGADPNRHRSQVRTLVERDNVFAVLPLSVLFFTGADYLAQHDIPTFGWNINAEWSTGPSLFGEKGSFLCFTCPGPYLSWLANQAGRSKAAVLAYEVDQSRDCATGQEKGYDRFGPANGVEMVFKDANLGFGFTTPAIAADIDQIRQKGADIVTTCIDGNASGRLAKALHDAGVDAIQYLPNGYNRDVIDEFADVLEGSYVATMFVPLEEQQPPEGLRDFLDAMEEAGETPNENALSGWINADLFVTGLKEAGENFTRASLVDAINKMENYTANGILAGIDWTKAHTQPNTSGCTATLKVEDGDLVPVFGEPGKPFVCFDPQNPDFDNPEIR